MKRFFGTLSAVAILTVALTACGGSGGTDGEARSSDGTVQTAEKDLQSESGSIPAGQTDDFPKQDINLMIGWAAGGGGDITSRTIMPYVEKILGAKIVIDYNAGSGGELSFTQLALNTPADGYHWTWICTPHLPIYPISRDTCEYTLDQIQPVCQIAYDPCIFAVTEDSQFNTLSDLITYAKEHPGEVTIGNGGVGGDDFIANMKFMEAAGVNLNQVAYSNGTGESVTALLGKHIDVATFNASESSNYEGLKLLGVMSEERVDIIPDTQTFREQGYDVIMSSDRGFAVPAGTDMEIVHKIADAIEQALDNPDFQKQAADVNLLLYFRGPEDFQKYIDEYAVDMQELYDSNPW